MLSIEKCKKILGNKAAKYSDEQLGKIRDELYIAANLAFENWRSSSTKGEDNSSPSVGAQTLVHPNSLLESLGR